MHPYTVIYYLQIRKKNLNNQSQNVTKRGFKSDSQVEMCWIYIPCVERRPASSSSLAAHLTDFVLDSYFSAEVIIIRRKEIIYLNLQVFPPKSPVHYTCTEKKSLVLIQLSLAHQTDIYGYTHLQNPISSFDYGIWDGFVSEGSGTLTGTASWYNLVQLS